ncbi:phage terminase small subunit P27 family [Lactiplantibacillus plantarum]|uniref:phage terminase small subunit P27 family n=1 Tax=Lactiplantibacillus plantarum TaxID=1590 RepID=UPI000C17E2F5|nr:phage terminase small subunit P27 family [Lactiplantibacillus plantarum]PKX77725.1 phage terminase small subunit P27 family [Lactiplantibacillus plantarum]WQE70968.1 phage terminase small subunit P27 family [Lactiplantibacillus plantarum]
MGRKVKPLASMKKHLTNDERYERKDAEKALFDYPVLDLTPPDWLHDRALTEWQRVAPYLKANTPISELDRAMLASYCRAYATVQTCENDIRKNGLVQTNQETGVRKANPYVALQSQAMKDMKAIANDLGMSLSSRARMELNKQKDETPEDTFEAMLS